MTKLAFIFVVLVKLVASATVTEDLTINLHDGKVDGKIFFTSNHKKYYGFQGLPYATPPVGTLRFKDPQLPRPWNGTWDATYERSACLSVKKMTDLLPESEDCLYINVYTPSLKPTKKLPVIFWIHGGAFIKGSSSRSRFNPEYIIDEDVVFVSFNYRLTSFGFLSTGDSAIRGNAGLKDQNLALKWTHKNIALFGGDPNKITIFGQSAGGCSASHHLLSKKSAGLFRAAIIGSGSATNIWGVDENPKAYAFLLADALNGSKYKNDTSQLKKFLQSLTAKEILNATLSLKNAQIWPVMEVEGDESFISQPPYQLVKSGNFNQVPIMIGITAEESLNFLKDLNQAKQIAFSYDSVPETIIPKNLKQNSSDTDAVIREIKDIYLKKGETFLSNLTALAKYYSDTNFATGVIKFAELSSKYVPVYFYQFAYFGRAVVKPFIDGAEKATHGSQYPFIFNIPGMNTFTAEDLQIQNVSVKLRTNFAKYLNPTPEPSSPVNLTWPRLTPTNLQFLNINGSLAVLPSIKQNTYPRWNHIYETYGKKPFITF